MYGDSDASMSLTSSSTSTSSTSGPALILNPNKRLFQEETWSAKYQQLQDFQLAHGHVNVPRHYPQNPSLGVWVQKQRAEYQLFQQSQGQVGAITDDRIDKLQSLGFQWSVSKHNQEQWMDMWKELQAFQRKYESTKVPILDSGSSGSNKKNSTTAAKDEISRLGRWVKDQRHYFNQHNKKQAKGKLSSSSSSPMTDERIALLDDIGFEWAGKRTTAYEKWLHQYFKLYHVVSSKQRTSDDEGSSSSDISVSDGQYGSLANWVDKQRRDYHKGNNKLSSKQIELLEELNFDWSAIPEEKQWDDFYQALQEYHATYQSTLVCPYVNGELGKWTTQQRRDYRTGKLPEDHIDKLVELGFDWDASDVSWNAMADRLVAYKRQFHTTIVPAHDGHDRPLSHWVIRQRNLYRKYVDEDDSQNTFDHVLRRIEQDIGMTVERPKKTGLFRRLSAEIIAARICRLGDIGFVWDPLEQQWLDTFKRLKEYQEIHKSTLVPKHYEDDPPLGEWVQKQRNLYHKQNLPSKRVDRLNSIEFIWDPQQAQWLEMLERLKSYQKMRGTAAVPGIYSDDAELGNWVSTQRKLYRRNALSEERLKLLKNIGFTWNVRSAATEEKDVAA